MKPYDFWQWFDGERAKHASGNRSYMSYQEISDKARSRGIKVNQSSIGRAIESGKQPTVWMCKVIAAGFDLPVLEVLRRGGHLSEVPDWATDDRASVKRAIKNLQSLSDDDIDVIIAVQEEMIRKQKAALRKGPTNAAEA